MKKNIILVTAFVIAALTIFVLVKGKDLTAKAHQLDLVVFSALKDSKVQDKDLLREKYERASYGRIYPKRILRITKEYKVPATFSQWLFQNRLERALTGRGFALIQSDFVYGKSERLLTFALAYRRWPFYTLILHQKIQPQPEVKVSMLTGITKFKKRPRVAIVIDDWGYSKNNLDILWQIKMPITLAILPNLPYSKEIANLAHKKRREVILHLPLEAKDQSVKEEENTIHTSMNESEVVKKLAEAITSVPHIKGISNHMGSKATESKDLMSIIFREMKRKKLFFLDSYSTSESVCGALAKEIGLRFVERETFLDNSDDPLEIRQKLYEAAADAAKNGFAVAIGHDKETTLEVIKETLPALEKSGVKFVYLSELVK